MLKSRDAIAYEYPHEINEAIGLLTHYFGEVARGGDIDNADAVTEIGNIVTLIFDAAVAEATRRILDQTS